MRSERPFWRSAALTLLMMLKIFPSVPVSCTVMLVLVVAIILPSHFCRAIRDQQSCGCRSGVLQVRHPPLSGGRSHLLRSAFSAPCLACSADRGCHLCRESPMDAFLDQTRHHLALFVERANGTFRYVVKINSGSDVPKHIFAGVFFVEINVIFQGFTFIFLQIAR